MSDGRQPRSLSRPFPTIVGRQPIGEPPPTASVSYAGQIRTFIGVSGYVDGLYICDTNLAGTWGWYKIHGHGQALGAQTINGNLTVAGNISATGGGDLAVDDISADFGIFTTVSANTLQANTLSLTTTPWRTILKSSVVSHAPPSIAAGSVHTFSIPLPGAATNDVAMVAASGLTIGIVPYAVAGTNEVYVCMQNVTTGAINPVGNNWVAAVIK